RTDRPRDSGGAGRQRDRPPAAGPGAAGALPRFPGAGAATWRAGSSSGRAGRLNVNVKSSPSPMAALGRRLARRLVPWVPQGVTPNQLTVLGLGCLVLAGLAFYLGSFERRWMLVGVAGVYVQWLSDHLDGTLARQRGLVSERGFFLDLFLDAVGLACLLLGLA